jgi:hypothetical protein
MRRKMDPNGPFCRLGTTISPPWRLARPEPTGVEEGDEAGDNAAPPPAPIRRIRSMTPTSSERDW